MERIEAATADDVPQLAALLGLLFAQEADFAPDRARQEAGLLRIVEAPELGRVFVAREGPEVVGMVSLLFTVSTATGGPACWLEDMVVRPDRRGGGLGSRLLRHAIAYARAGGFTRITLLTDGDNTAAVRFYERQGFERSLMAVLRLPL